MALRLSRRRFTVEEYYRMADAGVFSEDDRVELLEGEIFDMVAIGARHAACVNRLTQILTQALGQQAIVAVQNPVRLSEYSEPQPDLAVLRPHPDFYAAAHPSPPNVFLIIEVADATAETDRGIKVPLYARSGVAEVWLIDLAEQRVEVYRDPSAQGYRDQSRFTRGQTVRCGTLPTLTIPVEQVLV
jgi:Uma2 family endonuclease